MFQYGSRAFHIEQSRNQHNEKDLSTGWEGTRATSKRGLIWIGAVDKMRTTTEGYGMVGWVLLVPLRDRSVGRGYRLSDGAYAISGSLHMHMHRLLPSLPSDLSLPLVLISLASHSPSGDGPHRDTLSRRDGKESGNLV
ncbi:hypothetical protein VOLCADRAFT_99231 [Volvox carteri f. nagariensis]|uniref:Uncharacterized protein n=1 Tax=Volvox carteri f. nagariensis TaxID=3068 RepID=D8UHA2_VOLCA|nr:uncharacterized protein VOLCADRAFT_99231 [Volvox carteri f. nagariensis]EFJ40868.1 hypothetical protein VOLCADRAFT_99231 [Volvox carteri f. nagariensis]|eukprot:XP_002958028.1 hypothetical protein VOLCADRAFT_99231 [Volvox carteri f. nagariensis]